MIKLFARLTGLACCGNCNYSYLRNNILRCTQDYCCYEDGIVNPKDKCKFWKFNKISTKRREGL